MPTGKVVIVGPKGVLIGDSPVLQKPMEIRFPNQHGHLPKSTTKAVYTGDPDEGLESVYSPMDVVDVMLEGTALEGMRDYLPTRRNVVKRMKSGGKTEPQHQLKPGLSATGQGGKIAGSGVLGGKKAKPMSAKDIKNARQRGVNRAKSKERDLIKNGHQGTADDGWSLSERKRIAETGQYPSDTRWHHINDVKRNPTQASNPDNVIPSRGGAAGHVSKHHPKGTQAGSSGTNLNRDQLLKDHINGNKK